MFFGLYLFNVTLLNVKYVFSGCSENIFFKNVTLLLFDPSKGDSRTLLGAANGVAQYRVVPF